MPVQSQSSLEGGAAASSSSLLDNPIWASLTTDHARFALAADAAGGLARRYPEEIGPLSGMPAQSEEGYGALRSLVGPGRMAALFFEEPPRVPQGWTLARGGPLAQMVWNPAGSKRALDGAPGFGGDPADSLGRGVSNQLCQDRQDGAPGIVGGAEMRLLTAADSPAMVALAELTEPGPFRLGTIELGLYFGIFEDGRLVSMAGQRLSMPGFVEVSAVCTHPDARGRGYAAMLMLRVMEEITRAGKTPFLHTWADNVTAIRLYERLGYRLRRTFELAVVQREE